jgi:outer membrane protein assembly factor BamB
VYVGVITTGTMYALNATTGSLLWTFTDQVSGDAFYSSPAVANGVVYIAYYNSTTLYALNATTGAPLWSYTLDSSSTIRSSPAVANGMMYIGDDDFNFYAFGLPKK